MVHTPTEPANALDNEDLITLSEAVKLIARRCRGKSVNGVTAWRWTTTGVRGVILESLVVGRAIMTSRQALDRFFTALGDQRAMRYAQPESGDQPAQKKKTARRQQDRKRRIQGAADGLRPFGIEPGRTKGQSA